MLRRTDGRVDFSRPWADYQSGFGDPDSNCWLGLDTLHQLTHNLINAYTLRVDMESWEGQTYWAEYSLLYVASESDNYRLNVSGYNPTSTAGDSLTMSVGWENIHDQMQFSTYDRDNDR